MIQRSPISDQNLVQKTIWIRARGKEMSKLMSKFMGFFTSRSLVGADKHGNRYFTRSEEMDGILKEKRMVKFKGEEDPRSLPVEWICWLNGQRKRPPTLEEVEELDARRERVKQNVARLKAEEARNSKDGSLGQRVSTGKAGGPDLRSYIQQLKDVSLDHNRDGESQNVSEATDGGMDKFRKNRDRSEWKSDLSEAEKNSMSAEPTGSGASYRPGTWQPPA